MLVDPQKLKVAVLGSEDFHTLEAKRRGKNRVFVTARAGDTLVKIARRLGLEPGDLARVNRQAWWTELPEGQRIVAYTAAPGARELAAGRARPAARPQARPSPGQTPPQDDASPGDVEVKLPVTADLAGSRLDAFLVRAGAAATAGAARRLLEQGAVRVDGRAGRKGQLVAAGQTVELQVAPQVGEAVLADPAMPLTVLYQDAALVAVNKPAGWPTHPLRPGERGTLASALVARFPECASASRDRREAGFAHRLDTGTSGVIVAARDPDSWQALRRIIGGERCEKMLPGRGGAAAGAAGGRDGRRSRGRRRAHRAGGPALGAGARGGGARAAAGAHGDHGPPAAGADLAGRGAPAPRSGAPGARAPGPPGHAGAGRSSVWRCGRARALAAALGVGGFRLHAWRIRLVHPPTGAPLDIEAPPPDWA